MIRFVVKRGVSFFLNPHGKPSFLLSVANTIQRHAAVIVEMRDTPPSESPRSALGEPSETVVNYSFVTMCKSPIIIRNKRKDFRVFCDKLFIPVPCGKCEDCLRRKRDDYFVRLYYDWKDITAKGGAVYFPTLTFNDEFVPRVTLSDFDYLFSKYPLDIDRNQSVMTFDRFGLSRFIKKLRTYFVRQGFVTSESGIKYFVASEYGCDQNHTYRPHYHMLLELPFKLSDMALKKIMEHCWATEIKVPIDATVDDYPKSLLDHCDNAFKYFSRFNKDYENNYKNGNNIYAPIGKGDVCKYLSVIDRKGYVRHFLKRGIVSFSDKGAEILDKSCLSYCTKYLTKYQDYDGVPCFRVLSSYIESLPSPSATEDDSVLSAQIKRIKDVLPLFRQSKGIGISLYNELQAGIEDPDKHNETVVKLCNERLSFDADYTYAYPRYILDKVLREHRVIFRDTYYTDPSTGEIVVHSDKCTKVYLTPVAAECFDMMYHNSVRRLSDTYNLFFNTSYLHDLLSVVPSCYKDKLKNLVPCLDSSVDSELLAVYSLVYQNLIFTVPSDFELDERTDFIRYAEILRKYSVRSNDAIICHTPLHAELREAGMHDSVPLFNYHHMFYGFDYLLSLSHQILCLLAEIETYVRKNRERNSNALRDYFNNIKFI